MNFSYPKGNLSTDLSILYCDQHMLLASDFISLPGSMHFVMLDARYL